jgi:hypothetical protein
MTYPHARQIILALREGYGVEDIEAKGIALADDARAVVRRLRIEGLLHVVYPKMKRAEARVQPCPALTEAHNNGEMRNG